MLNAREIEFDCCKIILLFQNFLIRLIILKKTAYNDLSGVIKGEGFKF